jgi:transcriptional regulator with XRE-family HTH domain
MIEQIKHRLAELGWTQAQFAEAIDKSPQWVSDVLHGRRPNLTTATVQQLANALGIELVVRPEESDDAR